MNHCESVRRLQHTEDGEAEGDPDGGLETTETLNFGVFRLSQTLATIRVRVSLKT